MVLSLFSSSDRRECIKREIRRRRRRAQRETYIKSMMALSARFYYIWWAGGQYREEVDRTMKGPKIAPTWRNVWKHSVSKEEEEKGLLLFVCVAGSTWFFYVTISPCFLIDCLFFFLFLGFALTRFVVSDVGGKRGRGVWVKCWQIYWMPDLSHALAVFELFSFTRSLLNLLRHSNNLLPPTRP